MDKISVLVPTYKSTDCLDLCIRSLVEGCSNLENIEVLVGCDGTYDLNKPILDKWEKYIKVLKMEENVGTCRITNLLVYNASYDNILIINDDNVAPLHYDKQLQKYCIKGQVTAPNQVEPYPSMFRQFIIDDLGRDPKTFDLGNFWKKELTYRTEILNTDGSTFPIFINKYDYLSVGGLAEDYPSQSGFVSDWEFFMKCRMRGMNMVRAYDCNFYHFVSVSAKSPDQIERSKQAEIDCHEYAKYKWGYYIQHNPSNNDKFI